MKNPQSKFVSTKPVRPAPPNPPRAVKVLEKPITDPQSGKLVHAYRSDGVPCCGSKRRGEGKGLFCSQSIVFDNGRCRIHGGGALRGALARNYRGRSAPSVLLPKHLRGAYSESLNDPDQLNLSKEIGVIDSNLARLYGKLDNGERGTLFEQMQTVLNHLDTAMERFFAEGETAELQRWYPRLKAIVSDGVEEGGVWREINTTIALRAKTTEIETKRRLALKSVATADQLDMVIGNIYGAIRDEINDSALRSKLGKRIMKTLGSLGGPSAVAEEYITETADASTLNLRENPLPAGATIEEG